MARLSVVDGGLSTRTTRYAFLFAWAAAVVSSLIGGQVGFHAPSSVVACILVLCGVLLVTDSRRGPLRAVPIGLLTLATYAACALIVLTAAVARENWFLSEAVFLLALLIPRGNTRIGLLAVIVLLAGIVLLSLLSGFSAGDIAETLARPASAAVACGIWRIVILAILRRHTRALELRNLAAAEAEVARGSENRRRRGLETITRRAAPVLAQLAAGELLTEHVRNEALRADADIRDMIRFSESDIDSLLSAVAAARRRGVTVTLFGEAPNSNQGTSPKLQERLIEVLTHTLEGAVVIRFVPPGDPIAATALVTSADTIERLELAADGQIVTRR